MQHGLRIMLAIYNTAYAFLAQVKWYFRSARVFIQARHVPLAWSVADLDGKAYWEERSTDGNLVNLGNFDAKGVNGNRWTPDNRNGNLGVLLSRSVTKLVYPIDELCVCLIQPPIILPISCKRLS